MKLSRPSNSIFYISVGLAVLAILVFTGTLSLNIAPFWIMTAAFGILGVGVVADNI